MRIFADAACLTCGKTFQPRRVRQGRCSHACGTRAPKAPPPIDRFWAAIEPDLNSGCWLWSGSLAGSGYGQFFVQRRNICAHRFSYAAFVDQIPSGMLVCHRCDTPARVNPAHLFAGTHADNVRDCIAKGRVVRGSRSDRSATGICIRGHHGDPSARHCQECNRISVAAYQTRKRERFAGGPHG